MTIYVDKLRQWLHGYGDNEQAQRVGERHGHQWCHMFADEPSSEELHAFARRLGLRRKWFQHNHYDLVPSKRALAVQWGAVELTDVEAVVIWRKQRELGKLP